MRCLCCKASCWHPLRFALDRLEKALAQWGRHNRKGALLFVDLDNFKALNDTLGHDTGDFLLEQVGERLRNCVRDGDTVARLGGDEFVIAMPYVNSIDGVALAAEKIIKALSQPYSIQDSNVTVTASAGIGLYPNNGEDVKMLLKNADIALLDAKQASKNTYRISNRTS